MVLGFWFAIGLLIVSNLFMNFAWFGHLKLSGEPSMIKMIFYIEREEKASTFFD